MPVTLIDYFGSYEGGPFLVRFERSGKGWEAEVQMGGFKSQYTVRRDSRPSMGVAWRLVRREYKAQRDQSGTTPTTSTKGKTNDET